MSLDAPLFPLPGLDPPADQLGLDLEPRAADTLTERQRRIAELVADGLLNKQIAHELGIAPATVKNHVHAILNKLGLPRRAAIGKVIAK